MILRLRDKEQIQAAAYSRALQANMATVAALHPL